MNEMNETSYDLTQQRRTFSRIGLALCAILILTFVTQLLWVLIPRIIWGPENWLETSPWGSWLGSIVPMYLIAVPVGLLILQPIPAYAPEDKKLSFGHFLVFLPMVFCMTYVGNIIGNILSAILSGGNAQNAVADLAMDTHPMKIVVMVILAPLLEEFVFRKQIIDRTRKYGEKAAVFLSALIFGLVHGNLFQFFYAFGVGLILGYIYLRTGRLRYSVAIHCIVNFMGSVVATWILSLLDLELIESLDPNAPMEELTALYAQILPGMLIYLLYAMFLMTMMVTGLVLLIVLRKKLLWKEAPWQLPREACAKTIYLNVGMVLFFLLCAALFILALL